VYALLRLISVSAEKMMQLPMYGFKIKNKIYRTISGGDTKWLQTA